VIYFRLKVSALRQCLVFCPWVALTIPDEFKEQETELERAPEERNNGNTTSAIADLAEVSKWVGDKSTPFVRTLLLSL